jgi:transglutaminase-like putative cysteine protease
VVVGDNRIDSAKTPAPAPAAPDEAPTSVEASDGVVAPPASSDDAFTRAGARVPAARPGRAAPTLARPVSGGVSLRGLGIIPGSLLNPSGTANVAGADANLLALDVARARPEDRRTYALDPRGVVDPKQVADASLTSVAPAIRALIAAHADAKTVADAIAALYGPYRAENTAANRAAIIAALRFITADGTGLTYDHARAAANTVDNQSPNQTMTRGAGICRDFATASAAILASLIDARQVGGKWTAGSPDGQESRVQAFSYDNPAEFHAYTSFRDPITGGWNTLEYGTSYSLSAPSSPDAIARTAGGASGFMVMRINGWDGAPAVAGRGVLAAARANAFLELDPGVGEAGELRASASPSELQLTWFATPRVSLVSSLDPSALANGLRGGLKVSYHRDYESLPDGSGGYLHLAGGVYTDFFDASRFAGDRDAADRARYQVLVLGMQFDGRRDLAARELVDAHLKLKLGVDWNTRLGVPLRFGPGASTLSPGAVADYSRADAGADVTASGHEQLARAWQLDWALRLRGQVDLLTAGTEAVTGGSVRQTLGRDPWQAVFGLALTHESESGLRTRVEVAGTQFLAPPLDASLTPSSTHYAVLSLAPASGLVNFGLVARGETVDRRLVPVNALGVALDLRPTPWLSVGAAAETSLPGGDWARAGERLSLSVNAKVNF